MSIEESQTPEPIDEWLEQIAVQTPENEPPETLLADLELEAEVSTQEIAFNSDTIDSKTLTAENLNLLNTQAAAQVNQLQQVKSDLKAEIEQLELTYKTLQTQISVTQTALSQVVQESLSQLEQRKQALQISVEQLERRQERIRNEMRTSFAGTSQDIAIRVQGFKDYLTGSLQDLAAAAEQMQLLPPAKEREKPAPKEVKLVKEKLEVPQLGQQQFQDTTKKIRRLLDQYRNQPDYYGPPWQLRRTFEPIHAEKLSNWLFTLGGRGALRTMGSRLQYFNCFFGNFHIT